MATLRDSPPYEVRIPKHTPHICALTVFDSIVLFAGDLILNIDNPVTDAIPIGSRIALAVLSSAAVRSAGFQGVAISSLTPATQYVLCKSPPPRAHIP